MTATPTADLEAVRQFWNAHPLFTGVSGEPTGTRAFFEAHAAVTLYDHGGHLHPIFFRDVAPRARVLDAGCGVGFWAEQFARRGMAVSACDLTRAGVELTRARARLADLAVDVREGNVEALPYDDGTFDHVNCQGVVHHTPHPERCLAEFRRVLRPGGTICFSVYYRVMPLRSRVLFRVATLAARPFVNMRGRGRETLLGAPTPDEAVRRYDGADNPLGRAYTRAEARALAGPQFETLEEVRFGLPRHAIRVRVPDRLFRGLSARFGLLIAMRGRWKEIG